MSLEGIDSALLQDFLTESQELIEQLDADLVTLEAAADEERAELLNGVFRALHTIKGAASFLGIDNTIRFAHAAEDALNKLRKGEADLTQTTMDTMLLSVDVIREQIEDMTGGDDPRPGPEELIGKLHIIAEGEQAGKIPAESATATPQETEIVTETSAEKADVQSEAVSETTASNDDASSADQTSGEFPLKLPEQKADLVEFMVTDLQEQAGNLTEIIAEAHNDATKAEAATALAELAGDLAKTLDFFELDALMALAQALVDAAPKLPDLDDKLLDELLLRIEVTKVLLEQESASLANNLERRWPLDTLINRINAIATGQAPDYGSSPTPHTVNEILIADGIEPSDEASNTQEVASSAAPTEDTSSDSESVDSSVSKPSSSKQEVAQTTPEKIEQNQEAEDKTTDRTNKPKTATNVEQTVRVEVGRLEDLLNLVGQMVLSKNRMLALGRKMHDFDVPHEFAEQVGMASSDLDRLTGELQVGVMRTRMQPLAKLFDRYPRVIRDLARMTDKKILLVLEGKETEVDKSVLELLADPLVHILRNSADHGIEQPADRKGKGKDETGTIRLVAEHQGSHVRVAVIDDGKGIDKERIGKKAVERGLVSAEGLAQMSDNDICRFIFHPGLSTADKVSDLSGRGVGMDVVNSNVTRMNGQINVMSKSGEGTTIEILIPLTVAIMPAMMVEIGKHYYAIPLQSIVEIVRPSEQDRYTVGHHPVMRLRDTVLPLVNMQDRLDEDKEVESKFAVVVGVGGQRAGLMVDRLIGQQEIVIKPLDDEYTQGGPFSGATIREDGDVSLILDIVQLIRQAQADLSAHEKPAAA